MSKKKTQLLVNQKTGSYKVVMDVVDFGCNCLKREKGKWVPRL